MRRSAALADTLGHGDGRTADEEHKSCESTRERRVMQAASRQHGRRFVDVVAALALMAGLGFYAWRRAEQGRAETLADGVLSAPTDSVPAALENLRPVGRLAVDHLRERLNDSAADPLQKLRAAYALADLGQPPEAFLLDAIPSAPDAECRNLLAALQCMESSPKSNVLAEVGGRATAATEPIVKARYAIVALELGDPQPTQELLALRPDPVHRTTFIHAFAGWHGDLAIVAELLLRSHSLSSASLPPRKRVAPQPSGAGADAFRSGLCAALGTVAWESIPTDQRDAVIRSLVELYEHAPDGGTHSAAGWALRQWKHEPPPIATASGPSADRRWYVNGQGQTMIQLPAGGFMMGEPPAEEEEQSWNTPYNARLTRSFCLCDRELTMKQFMRFVEDMEYPSTEKPVFWKLQSEVIKNVDVLPPEIPAFSVNWFDAVLYCNWLSAKEGLPPAYERTGEKWKWKDNNDGREGEGDAWRCDLSSSGYRLPTEAEWEYACRALTNCKFYFGDDKGLLPKYGWTENDDAVGSAWPGARKLPNGWGLFDMYGNVWEWCYDLNAPYPTSDSKAVEDPRGPDRFEGLHRIMRGGSHKIGLPSTYRIAFYPDVRRGDSGFRLARTYP